MGNDIGTRSCPVQFDCESEKHARNWAAEFSELRAQCPIAWTQKYGGYWVATRYQDIVAMLQDDRKFSSAKKFDPVSGTFSGGISNPVVDLPKLIPLETDRPEWDVYRGFINRLFGPKSVETRRHDVRQFATALMNRVIEQGRMDLVKDFTSPLPAITTMSLVGLPLGKWRDFAEPVHELVYLPKDDPQWLRVADVVNRLFPQTCLEAFYEYKKKPRQENLLSHFAHEKIDGRDITEAELLSYCFLIVNAGVDTTTSLTTHALVHLHGHPQDKARLLADRSLLRVAREEFVRFFSPLHGGYRYVVQDITVGEASMRQGEPVYMAFAAANRDPQVFDRPEEIDIARYPNRHIGFGAGIHRCVGSFIARIMFEEMMQQVLDRIPDYTIDLSKAIGYKSVALINGWESLPVAYSPGPKVATDVTL